MSEKRKLRTIEMHRLSIDEYRNSRKLPLVVVLDNVRSLYNVGSIFRTCDAFRLEAICLCGITATPPHNELPEEDTGKYALVLGNEVKGVAQEVVDLCDECLEIPQYGTKHSMNVSVTAGIVIWEFAKQMLPQLVKKGYF